MNFLFDCVGAGFKGAVTKFFKLIFFAIIILIVVYIVGLFTSSKASALVRKQEQLWNPDLTKTYSHTFDSSNSSQVWAPFTFSSNWVNDTDYDLIGFKFNKLTYTLEYAYSNIVLDGTATTGNPGYTQQIGLQITDTEIYSLMGESLSFTGILFDKNGTGTQCWLSAEFNNTFICPIYKNTEYKSFEVIINHSVPDNYYLYLNMTLERTRFFYNYESTDLINSNGIIINQQQQINDAITDNNTTTSQSNSTTALNTIQQNMNTKLKGTNELTQMVMAPLTSLISISSTTCQPITWNIPLVNYTATIPCMSTIYNQYFSAVITLFATIITGVYSYRTIVKLVSTIKDALDAESDKLEVLDL